MHTENIPSLASWLCRSPDICVRSRSGRLMLLSSKTGTGLVLDATGFRIWEMLGMPNTIELMARCLAMEYRGNADSIAEDIKAFVQTLLAHNLIKRCPQPSFEEKTRRRYLYLLKKSLLNLFYPEHELRIQHLRRHPMPLDHSNGHMRLLRDIRQHLSEEYQDLVISRNAAGLSSKTPYLFSQTMAGMAALDNIEHCTQVIFSQAIPGDFIEAGVCRGGASIFMRALQRAYGEDRRRVWLADSFQGLPSPKAGPDVESGHDWSDASMPWFACSLDLVRDAFLSYGLLDAGVHFLKGWFPQPLRDERIERLALLRVDADMYESTRHVLETLYDKVSVGGFVIVDDYGFLPECRRAVDEFRASRGITALITLVNHSCAFWRVPEIPSKVADTGVKAGKVVSGNLFGLHVRSAFPLSLVFQGQEEPHGDPDLTINYRGRISGGLSEEPPYRRWYRKNDQWILEFGNVHGQTLTLAYSPDGRTMKVSHSFCQPEGVLLSLLGAGMAAALHLQGIGLFHASAVALQNGAFLLAGDSGSGKSTKARCPPCLPRGACPFCQMTWPPWIRHPPALWCARDTHCSKFPVRRHNF